MNNASSQNQIVNFCFNDHLVRTIIIEDDPWFIAKDVCEILDLKWQGSSTVSFLDDDEKGMSKVLTLGGEQDVVIISESGLYTLAIRSNKPEAKPFRKWVTSEVLPAIRKTGTYSRKKSQKLLWPDAQYAVAVARTREGELMAREFCLGVKVVKASGVQGRRNILKSAAALVGNRTGSDPLDYFGIDIEEHCPANPGNTSTCANYIAAELIIGQDDANAGRIRVRQVYDRFVSWYGDQISAKLTGLPTIIAFSKALFQAGAGVRKSGGTSYVFGLAFSADQAAGKPVGIEAVGGFQPITDEQFKKLAGEYGEYLSNSTPAANQDSTPGEVQP